MTNMPSEQFYDDITQLAAHICQTPMALFSLVDGARQKLKAGFGSSISEIPRKDSFFAHTILQPKNLLVVPDALADPRFSDNALVTAEPFVRFYAGVLLISSNGDTLGTLCVIDTQPRELDDTALSALCCLARLASAQLELGKAATEFQQCQVQLTQANQELIEQNTTDDLTNLKNRRAFLKTIADEWERTFRYSNPLSLLIIDIDQFKPYRDKYGRLVGDKALNKIAQLISQGARQMDVISRFGDDQFTIVLPETDSDGALKIAERIRYRVELEEWPHRPLTISVGLASYNGQADADKLLADADQALARAKQAGRNCVMTTR
jgi:diguanylate cyclase (GGDEF)-like protein